MIVNLFKKFWKILSKLSPNTRSAIIIILLGYIMYFQINQSTHETMINIMEKNIKSEKQAEQYTKDTANQINQWVKLIQERDQAAFDVLLLNYHNNTQSLQGYKYLYLSCLVEQPRSVDTPLLKSQWNNIDYIYYVDELTKIHSQNFVKIQDITEMKIALPKLYHLVKGADAKSISFFTVESNSQAIGMIVIFYDQEIVYDQKDLAFILKTVNELAKLLDYENVK